MKREINMRKQGIAAPIEKNFENKSIMATEGRINTDPYGSYTGVPTTENDDIPIQDVDDL